MTRLRLTTLASLLAFAPATAALAQMSSDQIIQSLRPGTRGIRPVGPSTEPPVSQRAPSGPSASNAVHTPSRNPPVASTTSPAPASVNLTVQFATGSAELTPQAVRTLDELGRALSSTTLAGFRFRIEGHTDTVGSPEANRALSEARAAKVLDYLATKWSIDRNRVQTVGMGQEQPLVLTGPGVAEPRNRRVTVVNLGA